MPLIDPDFSARFEEWHLAELDAADHVVMGLRPDDTLAYRNRCWDSFAVENGGPKVELVNSLPVTSTFHPSVRSFYADLFAQVRCEGVPGDHRYQCSSPENYREYNLRVVPLGDGYLLLEHHLVVREPHHWATNQPSDRYLSPRGVATVCCHCRRTRRDGDHATWDWVPAFLTPDRTDVTHGLCGTCFQHYYPEDDASRW